MGISNTDAISNTAHRYDAAMLNNAYTSLINTSITFTNMDKMRNSDTTNINNKEKKDMKSKSIVELYFANLKAAVEEKTNKIVKELMEADSIVTAIQQKINEIRNIISDNKENLADKYASFDVEIGDLMTVDTEAAITKAYEEKKEENIRLDTLKKEIMTMLTPCETYNDEMEILFAYGIIDDDGKLIHPEPEDDAAQSK